MALVHERRSSLLVDRARREERSLDTQLLEWQKPQDTSVSDIIEAVQGGSMPPFYYAWMPNHPKAKLSTSAKAAFIHGLQATFKTSPPAGGGGGENPPQGSCCIGRTRRRTRREVPGARGRMRHGAALLPLAAQAVSGGSAVAIRFTPKTRNNTVITAALWATSQPLHRVEPGLRVVAAAAIEVAGSSPASSTPSWSRIRRLVVADRGGHAFDRAVAHVTRDEQAALAGLEEERGAGERPRRRSPSRSRSGPVTRNPCSSRRSHPSTPAVIGRPPIMTNSASAAAGRRRFRSAGFRFLSRARMVGSGLR